MSSSTDSESDRNDNSLYSLILEKSDDSFDVFLQTKKKITIEKSKEVDLEFIRKISNTISPFDFILNIDNRNEIYYNTLEQILNLRDSGKKYEEKEKEDQKFVLLVLNTKNFEVKRIPNFQYRIKGYRLTYSKKKIIFIGKKYINRDDRLRFLIIFGLEQQKILKKFDFEENFICNPDFSLLKGDLFIEYFIEETLCSFEELQILEFWEGYLRLDIYPKFMAKSKKFKWYQNKRCEKFIFTSFELIYTWIEKTFFLTLPNICEIESIRFKLTKDEKYSFIWINFDFLVALNLHSKKRIKNLFFDRNLNLCSPIFNKMKQILILYSKQSNHVLFFSSKFPFQLKFVIKLDYNCKFLFFTNDYLITIPQIILENMEEDYVHIYKNPLLKNKD